MKLFLDSAKLPEIEKANSCGILDGVTTNPALIKTAMEDLNERGEALNIWEYTDRIMMSSAGIPVILGVTESSCEGIANQGRALYYLFNPVAGNVYIKVPVNPSFAGERGRDLEGTAAIKTLSGAGIPVTATFIFTPEQALMAAKAGAKIVCLHAGKLDDYILTQHGIKADAVDCLPAEGLRSEIGVLDDNGIVSGVDLIKTTVSLFRKYNIGTQIMAASIRSVRQVREVALAGADIATLPLSLIEALMDHPKTREGMELFKQGILQEYADLTKK
ncbi:MAG: transaldolase family protein [Candidatus Altiarchaeia archaeon]